VTTALRPKARSRPFGPVLRASTALAAALTLAGCGGGTDAQTARPAPTAAAPTAVAPTAVAPTAVAPTAPSSTAATTTTVFAPSTPEATAEAAVARLLATWDAGDRVSAGYIATPAAVAALFAVPGHAIEFRGCSDGQPPITCSYADRSATGNFYDITALQTATGAWYVSDVQVTPL
jgi:predicted lipid-binding transport protein (Tim44 family)